MTVKVGDIVPFGAYVRPNELEALPAGTVVKDPLGGIRVRASHGDVAMWTDKGISPKGDYEVIHVVDAAFPPYSDLAEELYQGFFGGETVPFNIRDKNNAWYGLAKWVLENFTRNTKPSRIVDLGYTTWYLQKNGNYSSSKVYDNAFVTYEELKRQGIDEEIA